MGSIFNSISLSGTLLRLFSGVLFCLVLLQASGQNAYQKKQVNELEKKYSKAVREFENAQAGNYALQLGQYHLNFNTEKSIDYFQLAIDQFGRTDQKTGIALAYEGIGVAYDSLGDHLVAINNYTHALNLYRHELVDRNAYAQVLYQMAMSFYMGRKKKNAIQGAERSLTMARELDNQDLIVKNLELLRKWYEETGQKEKALAAFKEYTEVAQQVADGYIDKIEDQIKKDIVIQEQRIKEKDQELEEKQQIIQNIQKEKEQIAELERLRAQEIKQLEEMNLLKQQETEQAKRLNQLGILFALVVLVLIGIIFFILLRTARRRKRKNDILAQQNKEIAQQNREIAQQKLALEKVNDSLLEKQEEINAFTEELQLANQKVLDQKEAVEQQKFELEKSNESLALYGKIGKEITKSLDPEKVLQVQFQALKGFMEVDVLSFFEFDEAGQRISMIEDGIYSSFKDVKSDKSHPAWLAQEEARLVHIKNLKDSDYALDFAFLPQSGQQVYTSVFIPLYTANLLIGVLGIHSFLSNAYNGSQLETLSNLASYSTIALSNVQTFSHLEEAKNIIETKNRHITDSIRYAMTIQQTLLPEQSVLTEAFSDSFVLYKPKDFVSGDFYWWKKTDQGVLVICSDCTGHGVPGAFMSLIGIMLIEEAIEKHGYDATNLIFQEINEGISRLLKQEDKNNNDGMEAVICHIKPRQDTVVDLTYTGAKRPLYLIKKNGELEEHKPDRKSIGGYRQLHTTFSKTEVVAEKGDMIYLTSDGFQDQNNSKNLKFGIKTVREMFKEHYAKTGAEQKELYSNRLAEWMGDKAQRDDISIVGIRL